MKGKLVKSNDELFVKYRYNHLEKGYQVKEITLLRDFSQAAVASELEDGAEVEFEFVCNEEDGKFYAKISDTARSLEAIAIDEYEKLYGSDTFGMFPNASDQDVWISGFITGYSKK